MAVSEQLSTVIAVGKKYGIDEAIDFSASKIDIKNWVAAKCKYCCPNFRQNCQQTALPPEELKKIVSEYRSAILVVGKGPGNFRDAVLEMEAELLKKGFYKAFALISGAEETQEQGKQRPRILSSGIDLTALMRRFKKNFPPLKTGECPSWAVILVD